jgi:hypothetical protein
MSTRMRSAKAGSCSIVRSRPRAYKPRSCSPRPGAPVRAPRRAWFPASRSRRWSGRVLPVQLRELVSAAARPGGAHPRRRRLPPPHRSWRSQALEACSPPRPPRPRRSVSTMKGPRRGGGPSVGHLSSTCRAYDVRHFRPRCGSVRMRTRSRIFARGSDRASPESDNWERTHPPRMMPISAEQHVVLRG